MPMKVSHSVCSSHRPHALVSAPPPNPSQSDDTTSGPVRANTPCHCATASLTQPQRLPTHHT